MSYCDSGFALSRLRTGATTTMELTFRRPARFEGRPTALLSRPGTSRRAATASDQSTSGGQSRVASHFYIINKALYRLHGHDNPRHLTNRHASLILKLAEQEGTVVARHAICRRSALCSLKAVGSAAFSLTLFGVHAQPNLQPCPPDQGVRWHNCFGSSRSANGAIYVGEYRYGERHGLGTHIWPDGTNYVGEFRDDVASGRGIMYSPKGAVIQSGRWENDKLTQNFPLDPTDFRYNPFSQFVLNSERNSEKAEQIRLTADFAADQRKRKIIDGSIQTILLGSLAALILAVAIIPRKNPRPTEAAMNDDREDSSTKKQKKSLLTRWSVRLGLIGVAMGYFIAIGQGRPELGFIIGFSIPCAATLGFLGLIIDLIAGRKRDN
jgi:hypothetical protein